MTSYNYGHLPGSKSTLLHKKTSGRNEGHINAFPGRHVQVARRVDPLPRQVAVDILKNWGYSMYLWRFNGKIIYK